MNYEIITIIGAWASLALFIWSSHRDLHKDIIKLHEKIASLEHRIVRVEGLFDGFMGKRPSTS